MQDHEKLPLYMLVVFAFAGCVALYVVHRTNNRQPFSLLTGANIKITAETHPIVVITDIVLSSLLGAVVVCASVSPTTPAQAVMAGLGLTGLLSAHSKIVDEKEGEKVPTK